MGYGDKPFRISNWIPLCLWCLIFFCLEMEIKLVNHIHLKLSRCIGTSKQNNAYAKHQLTKNLKPLQVNKKVPVTHLKDK